MVARDGYIEVEGWRELQRAARRAADRDLPKRLGQANKKIGQRFIRDWLEPKPDPAAVGTGAGATVRPSASKREVLLRVGGAHRAGKTPRMQWGRRTARRPGVPAPKRPFIRESAEKHRDEIEQAWLEAVSEAMDPAFWKTEP
jgi:hypothetical protein